MCVPKAERLHTRYNPHTESGVWLGELGIFHPSICQDLTWYWMFNKREPGVSGYFVVLVVGCGWWCNEQSPFHPSHRASTRVKGDPYWSIWMLYTTTRNNTTSNSNPKANSKSKSEWQLSSVRYSVPKPLVSASVRRLWLSIPYANRLCV